MIRARVRSHLDALRQQFPSLLGNCEVQASLGTDYAFRIFVDKPVWAQVTAKLAEELDYDNFKAEVGRHQGAAGSRYEHALHTVWEVMYELQTE